MQLFTATIDRILILKKYEGFKYKGEKKHHHVANGLHCYSQFTIKEIVRGGLTLNTKHYTVRDSFFQKKSNIHKAARVRGREKISWLVYQVMLGLVLTYTNGETQQPTHPRQIK